MRLRERFITITVSHIGDNMFVLKIRTAADKEVKLDLNFTELSEFILAQKENSKLSVVIFYDTEAARCAFEDECLLVGQTIHSLGLTIYMAHSLLLPDKIEGIIPKLYFNWNELRRFLNIGSLYAKNEYEVIDVILNKRIGCPTMASVEITTLLSSIALLHTGKLSSYPKKFKNAPDVLRYFEPSDIEDMYLNIRDSITSLTTEAQILRHRNDIGMCEEETTIMRFYKEHGGLLKTFPITSSFLFPSNKFRYHVLSIEYSTGLHLLEESYENYSNSWVEPIKEVPDEFNIDNYLVRLLDDCALDGLTLGHNWCFQDARHEDYMPISYNELVDLYDKIFDSEYRKEILGRITYDTIKIDKSILNRLNYFAQKKKDIANIKMYRILTSQYLNILNALLELPSDFMCLK